MKFVVRDAELVLDGETFKSGEQEVEKPSKALVRLLNHAHATGAVELEGADPQAHGVQSQEEGEAAYAAAQADGSWQEGHAAQVALDDAAKERGELGDEIDVTAADVGDVL